MKINKHTHNFEGSNELFREGRVVWQAGPTGLSSSPTPGGNLEDDAKLRSYREEAEKIRPLVEAVESALKTAARGNRSAEELMRNDNYRLAMLALLEYEKDRGVQWFKKGQIDVRVHEAFKGAEKELNDLKQKAEEHVDKYFERLEKYQKELDEAVNNIAESDKTLEIRGASEVVGNITGGKNEKALRDRQRVILSIAQSIVGMCDKSYDAEGVKKRIRQIIKGLSKEDRSLVPDLQERVEKSIDDYFVGGGKNFDKSGAEKTISVLREMADLPPIEWSSDREIKPRPAIIHDRVTILLGLRDAESKAVEVREERKRHIIKRFPERAKYLYLLAGANSDRLISHSTRSDYKVDLDTMNTIFEAMGVAMPPDVKKHIEDKELFDVHEDKVKSLSGRLNISEDGIKEIAQRILLYGKFEMQTNAAHSFFVRGGGEDRNYAKYFEFFFGKEGEKAVEEARSKGVELDTISLSGFVNLHRPYLVMCDKAADAFASVWKKEKIAEYLRKNEYNNPTTIDVPAAIRRSGLPSEFGDYLEKRELDIGLGALCDIAKFDEFEAVVAPTTVGEVPGLSDRLFSVVIDPDSGEFDKEEAEDILAFLLSKASDAPGGVIEGDEYKTAIDAISDVGFFTKTGEEFYLIPAKKEELIEKINSISITADVAGHLKTFRESGLHTIETSKSVKLAAHEIGRLIGEGGSSWFDYVTSIPRNVIDTDDKDSELLDILNREKALSGYRSVLSNVLGEFKDKEDGMKKAFETMFRRDASQHLAKKDIVEFVNIPGNSAKMAELAGLFLEKQKRIQRELEPFWEHHSWEIRKVAIFIANQPNTDPSKDDSLERAKEYLRNPAEFKLTADERARGWEEDMSGYEAKEIKIRLREQKDVMLPAEEEMGVKMIEKALDLLGKTKGKKKKSNLLDGAYHFDNWLEDPENAELPLRTILYDVKDFDLNVTDPSGISREEAIIMAFCNGKDIKLSNNRVLTFADARDYVAGFQQDLKRQRGDFQQSPRMLERENRFTHPLEFFRAGADSIAELFKSGDIKKQLAAVAIVGSIGYVLLQAWKKKGLGKKLMIGIPLFFGIDHIMRDMTGKGAFERLGLTFMNEKDRNSAVEQFMRRHEKEKEYKYMGTKAGFESIQQLMNPDSPYKVEDLIKWREQARKGPAGTKISDGAPEGMSSSARRVKTKLGSLDKRNYPREEEEEIAYDMLLKSFEALCVDVAKANGKSGVKNGMDIIRERYVDFTAEHIKGFKKEFKQVSSQRPGGGYSMLDVLVFERATPAMGAEIHQNERLLERLFIGTGLSFAFVQEQLKKGYSYMEIIVKRSKEAAPNVYEAGKEWTLDTYESVKDWVWASYPKAKAEVVDNLVASWDVIARTAKAAGLIAKAKGPEAIEWVFDSAIDVGSFTIDSAQNLYSELHRHQITGNAIEGLDAVCERILGASLTSLIILRSKVERDDEHVEELANLSLWKSNLKKQISTIANSPTDTQIDGWLRDYSSGVGLLPAHERMAAYELIKRRMYSHLIAERMKTIDDLREGDKLPEKLSVSWDKIDTDELTKGVEQSYGLNSLRFIGAENTLAGAVDAYKKEFPEGMIHGSLGFLHWSVDWATRNKATDYLVHQFEEYLSPYIHEAEVAFEGEPEKLEQYKAYLETILTNAVMEVTMGARESTDPSISAKESATLALTISQAKDFLVYLKALRGSSADIEKLEDFDFSKFSPKFDSDSEAKLRGMLEDEGYADKLRSLLPEIASSDDISGGATNTQVQKPLTEDQIADLPPEAKDGKDQKENLDALGGIASSEDAQKIREKFDKAIPRAIPSLPSKVEDLEEKMEEYARLLEGATAPKRRELENKLLTNLNTSSDLLPIASVRDRCNRPNGRMQLQHLLDRGVIKILDEILSDIKEVDSDSLERDSRYVKWKDQLVELYVATSPQTDRLTDIVSMSLEYLLYRGDHSSEEKGETNIKKYEAFLAAQGGKHGRTLVPPKEYRYQYGTKRGLLGEGPSYIDACRSRMRRSGKLSMEHVDSFIRKRLEFAKEELE